MIRTRIVTDLDECRRLWEEVFPQEHIGDLWEVRACFQRYYRRPAHFVVAEDRRGVIGLLPLSWIAETAGFAYFPGETWEGRTWLEQNRIFARDGQVLERLLGACPGGYELRYLLPHGLPPIEGMIVDEVGYLFSPSMYGYDIEAYFGEFSHKRRKRLQRELDELESRGLRFRLDVPTDFAHLLRLNEERFGERSYFADPRFRRSMRALLDLLRRRGELRMTTVLAGAEPVAVDLGSLHDGVYTLLAGGTHSAYPGIAKLINLQHMRRACEERMERVDFLCGDFSWKTLFHLRPRPLYLLSSAVAAAGLTPLAAGSLSHAR